MSDVCTHKELVDRVAARCGSLSRRDVHYGIKHIIEQMTQAMERDRRIFIDGWGWLLHVRIYNCTSGRYIRRYSWASPMPEPILDRLVRAAQQRAKHFRPDVAMLELWGMGRQSINRSGHARDRDRR